MFLSQIFIYLVLSTTILGTLFEPYIGVITYYVFDLIRPQNLFWWSLGGSRLSFWVAGATIISWIFHLLKDRKKGVVWTTQNKLMICFWATIILAHIFSYYKDVSWVSFVRINKILMVYFVAVNLINSQKRIRWLVWCLVLSVGYLAIRGNWQYFFLGYHRITALSFGRGQWLDNNGYAMLFVMVLPFMYFLIFSEKRILVRIFLIALIPILIHAILLTYSRGGFLGMCGVCGLCLLKTKKKAVMGIAGILFIAVILRLAGSSVIERIETIPNYQQEETAISRIEAWKAGLRMMTEHPVVGIGLDNYRYLAKEYNPEGLRDSKVAHNAFIHTGGEAGIPAMILFILLVFYCFRDLRNIEKQFYTARENWKYYYPSMFEASLWGYFICGMFLTLAWFELFYVLVALIVSLKQVARETDTAEVRKVAEPVYA